MCQITIIRSRLFAVLHSESPTKATIFFFRSDAAMNRGSLSPPQGCLFLHILSEASVVDNLITLSTAALLIFRSQNRLFFVHSVKVFFVKRRGLRSAFLCQDSIL